MKRGLLEEPHQWIWSSYRANAFGEIGIVRVNYQEWAVKIKQRARQSFLATGLRDTPLIRKQRESVGRPPQGFL